MEGKKSFVLYTDLMDIVNDLSDEQAGKLVKLIVNYVNDRNPETDDLLINIAFKPIKMQLKRDLEKWNDIKIKRSESGKLGGRPKAIQEESNESELNQTEAKKANGFFDKQTKSKKAVNVNVNVNDIYNNSEFQADANKDLEGYQTYIHETLKGKQISIDTLLKNTGIYPEWKEELYMAFLKNAIEEVPQITDEKHAYNTFKLFVRNNAKNYNKPKSKIKDNWW